MDIVDWFDVENKDHLLAYYHLDKKGVWPEGFIPENVTFNPAWHGGLAHEIALKHIESVCDKKDCSTCSNNDADLYDDSGACILGHGDCAEPKKDCPDYMSIMEG